MGCCCFKDASESDTQSLLGSHTSLDSSQPRQINYLKNGEDPTQLTGTPSSPSVRANRHSESILANVNANLIEYPHEFLHTAQCDERMKLHEQDQPHFFGNIHVRESRPRGEQISPNLMLSEPQEIDESVLALTSELCETIQEQIRSAGGVQNVDFIF